jgi:hypothetical protein
VSLILVDIFVMIWRVIIVVIVLCKRPVIKYSFKKLRSVNRDSNGFPVVLTFTCELYALFQLVIVLLIMYAEDSVRRYVLNSHLIS